MKMFCLTIVLNNYCFLLACLLKRNDQMINFLLVPVFELQWFSGQTEICENSERDHFNENHCFVHKGP